jgi:hypothetical protein
LICQQKNELRGLRDALTRQSQGSTGEDARPDEGLRLGRKGAVRGGAKSNSRHEKSQCPFGPPSESQLALSQIEFIWMRFRLRQMPAPMNGSL